MADINYNDIPNIDTDWQGYSGQSVQKFIKEQLNAKMGVFYYDTTNNRYLVFASEDKKNEYIADPTLTNLVLGTFDAPFNYSAEINLTSAPYNAVFLGSTGNTINFTFDIKNKQGSSTLENVTITYTFIRNSVKKTFTEKRKHGDVVSLNIDKYLDEGTNTIMISLVGDTTLAATTLSIVYQVVNLSLTDGYDISQYYNLKNGSAVMEIPFTVSGYGTKVVEWYIDGVKQAFVKSEDEATDSVVSRTKRITLSNIQHGKHSLQMRAYTTVNGESFYTPVLYRDFFVNTGAGTALMLGIATTVPLEYGVLTGNSNVALYGVVQYEPYTLRFASYSPLNLESSSVRVTIDGELKGTVMSSNNIVNEFVFTPTTSGTKTLRLTSGDVVYALPVDVLPTTMDIEEITTDLVLNFNADGKSNNSTDRNTWTDGTYTGTLTGFHYNDRSGWVDGRLDINAGATFAINLAPLSGTPTATGKTIEIEWYTRNVSNDNAVICDLRDTNGAGILITATKVSLISANGVQIDTEYKSDENVRVGFVINRANGVAEQRLSYIYTNGIVSRGDTWAITDSYTSIKTIAFKGTDEAEVSLKAIRVYNTALTANNMLNNYILYRDTIDEMRDVYDRNDIYESGSSVFSIEKMSSRLPVMVVTGDIPTLENTSNKDTQIVVDIEYTNMQHPEKSFRMVNAAMRPQGTSSMGYPKKNFRIYTTKLDNTILYDANGNVVEDKLYSFKDKAQPVDCWCLKADYAESSGTHNTGIARLWNNALFNAQVDGEYKLRTEAQKAALLAKYDYDVRTTIDGFPILLFYRPSANDELIFIGKYNFNNDKSTESVFGFTGIPGFNNERMQCWEVLNNGHALALFTTASNFDSEWSNAFESRYPDTKTPNTADLKAFCQWMVNVSQSDFATQKWQHLNVYMMAAYWCYLMRHAGADQFVKNAMFTSEDGQHFYYILYDNDTINGLVNTGKLQVPPTADRQTKDASGEYYFAGHDSRLWNMLEADSEFMRIVSQVDNALYSAGISYINTIKEFDNEQADKWVERVYNQDAQYKYVSPFTERGVNNLFMLQGKRDLHRKWWLAKRFSIYDAKYVSGTYKSQAIELKCINNTPVGQKFTIKAGYPIDYGYGINDLPRVYGISLNVGDTYTFSTAEVVNLGDPIRIYSATNISELDLSQMADRLAVVTIANVYTEANGTKLTKLIVGRNGISNMEVADISGLKQAIALEYLDVQGMKKITSLDLSSQPYIKTVKAYGSGVSSIIFTNGAPVEYLELPASMTALQFESLPYLVSSNIHYEDISKVYSIIIRDCPNITSGFAFINEWYNNKTAEDRICTLILDNVNWSGITGAQMTNIANIANNGGNVSLKGRVSLLDMTKEQAQIIVNAFGETAFNPGAELFIDAPVTVSIKGPTLIYEGDTAKFTAEVYPSVYGTFTYSLPVTRTGCSINRTTGEVTTTETGEDTSNIVVRATFTPSDGGESVTVDQTVSVVKRVYPDNLTIVGDTNLVNNQSFTWSTTTAGANGDYDVIWSLSGAVASYYTVDNANSNTCTLVLTKNPTTTVRGTLTCKLAKKADGSIVISNSTDVYHPLSSLTITIKSNQGTDSTIAAVKATIKYDSTTLSVASGSTVYIPIGKSVTVTYSEVNGYTTPASVTYTTSTESKSITATYNTELLTVNVTSDAALPTGYRITVSNIGTQTTASKTYKVPYGTNYTVSASAVDGYTTPASQSFTANSVARTVTVTYYEQTAIVTTIVFDTTVSDPNSIIKVIKNKGAIEQIRANTHRYTGYKTYGVLELKQLDDKDGRKYVDGTDADLTTLGTDVFVRLPRFYWKAWIAKYNNRDCQHFSVAYGEKPDDTYNVWDGKDLIGVYAGFVSGGKIYSVANRYPSGSTVVPPNIGTSIFTNRGSGYRGLQYKHGCIIALLFYMEYRTTNSEILGTPGNSFSDLYTGSSNSLGMSDSTSNSGCINIFGLENWISRYGEYFVNAYSLTEGKLSVMGDDGVERTIDFTKFVYPNQYIVRISIDNYLNISVFTTPLYDGGQVGSSSTYFCDYGGTKATSSSPYYLSHNDNSANGTGIMAFVTQSGLSLSHRLTYRGDYVITNTLTFPVTLYEGDNGETGVQLYHYLCGKYKADDSSKPEEMIIINDGVSENKVISLVVNDTPIGNTIEAVGIRLYYGSPNYGYCLDAMGKVSYWSHR